MKTTIGEIKRAIKESALADKARGDWQAIEEMVGMIDDLSARFEIFASTDLEPENAEYAHGLAQRLHSRLHAVLMEHVKMTSPRARQGL